MIKTACLDAQLHRLARVNCRRRVTPAKLRKLQPKECESKHQRITELKIVCERQRETERLKRAREQGKRIIQLHSIPIYPAPYIYPIAFASSPPRTTHTCLLTRAKCAKSPSWPKNLSSGATSPSRTSPAAPPSHPIPSPRSPAPPQSPTDLAPYPPPPQSLDAHPLNLAS